MLKRIRVVLAVLGALFVGLCTIVVLQGPTVEQASDTEAKLPGEVETASEGVELGRDKTETLREFQRESCTDELREKALVSAGVIGTEMVAGGVNIQVIPDHWRRMLYTDKENFALWASLCLADGGPARIKDATTNKRLAVWLPASGFTLYE